MSSKPVASPRLSVLDEPLAVCRLNAEAGIPDWTAAAGFYSLTRTVDELSVVCGEEHVPEDVQCERGWRAFKVEESLDFSLVGVIAGIAAPLAKAGVSVFVVSTYETDYVLVRDEMLDLASSALRGAGYEVI